MRRVFVALVVLTASLVATAAPSAGAPQGHTAPSTIAILADTPYGAVQADNFEVQIDAINSEPGVRTVVHLGDTKSGGTSCDDAYLDFVRAQFRQFKDPLFYTPGDNEWTDCHRDSNGDFNPVERLTKIRNTYFKPNLGQSLSNASRSVSYQSRKFPENQSWYQSGVQVGLVHIVGSNNGLRPWELGADAEDLPAEREAEVEARTEAAIEWIDQIFNRAEKKDAAGVLLMIHADMWGVFEFSGGDDMSGFTPIVEKLAERTEAFGKPVLLVNGDSHDYYTWKPLSDTDTHPNAEFYTWRGTDLATVDSSFYHGVGGDIDNLTQVVVEIWDRFDPEPEELADEDYGWLEVNIDPSTPEVFSFEQRYVDTSEALADEGNTELAAWASLPADTFAEGPASGNYISDSNGRTAPFDGQPVQGFSAVLDNGDGSYLAMSDNGFGGITNSADYNLRAYNIKPNFRTADGGEGTIEVIDFIEFSDPDGHIPFATVNHFSEERVLTGADFDIESIQRDANGDIWIGDEFGPFMLHFDAEGKLLEAPIALPNPDGGELRASQNPYNEEIATLRTMNALRAHAQANGNTMTPVVSPWYVMLTDNFPEVDHPGRVPSESDPSVSADGLTAPANSQIHNVNQLHAAGYQVVPYTINDADEMKRLIELGVDGIISDRSDLLYEVVAAHDADGDGVGGDWLLEDGRIDQTKFDAQGHRGARNLRPENTIPAMEVALDDLMNTLEFDTGITSDGVAVLNHDPVIEPSKCRMADGSDYTEDNELLVKDITAEELQDKFVCDALFRGESQVSDLELSPVSVAFAAERGIDPYVMPTLEQVFAFVDFYAEYYTSGAGAAEEGAAVKAANAAEVRYNIETKLNPTDEGREATLSPQAFVDSVMGDVRDADEADATFIQSFDWSSLLLMHEQHPDVQTVALYGDFPGGDGAGGTNLQDYNGENTPWLAGLHWPWRETNINNPVLVPGSGGFEGMALAPNGNLYAMLEKPLRNADERVLLVSEFNPKRSAYTGRTYLYPLEERGTAIGDFIMFSNSKGLVIERDGSQGDLDGFKAIYEVTFNGAGNKLKKNLLVDLLDIADPNDLGGDRAEDGSTTPGDVGVGDGSFAFPFVTIEDVVIIDEDTIGVLNDNNYPFSVGRHLGDEAAGVDAQPDDNEFILLDLPMSLKG